MGRTLPLAVTAALLLAASSAFAQERNWAYKMCSQDEHDFGVVARGADVEHRIQVKNVFKEDVHISGVKTACGCTAAEASRTTLATGETADILIEMDTKKFSRRKDSAVIVTFDRPLFAEVRIPVTIYIRTDVVFTPGSVNFGRVDLGTSRTSTVDVAYAGRDDWRIKDVQIGSEHLSADVVETGRGDGLVNYELQFTLAESAPEGTLRQQVYLVTDDAGNPKVPLLVEADVEADVTITPSVVSLGRVSPGETVRKNLVVRGKQPFSIEKIECESQTDAFRTKLPEAARPVHVLPLAFTAPDEPGEFAETFTVTIAGRPQPVTFKAYGTIVGK